MSTAFRISSVAFLVFGAFAMNTGAAASTDTVAFDGHYEQLNLGWDSGYYPPGNPEPGGTAIQVHLMFDADAYADAHVAGEYVLDSAFLAPGSASGDWGYEFGAVLVVEVAFDITFLGYHFQDVIPVPYIPNFDLHTSPSETFDSYLLDDVRELSGVTEPATLFSYDLMGAVLGLLNLPSWLEWVLDTVNAGISLDSSIETVGTLTCNNMATGDGVVFTEEGQLQPVDVSSSPYETTMAYNEDFNWNLTLHNWPTVFISLAGLRWDYPIIDIPWTVFSGRLEMVFNDDDLSLPVVGEGEGEEEGEEYGPCGTPICRRTCPGGGIDAGFEDALRAFYANALVDYDPDTQDADANGIVDAAHARLLDVVLLDDALPIHCCVYDAWLTNLALANGYADQVEAQQPLLFSFIDRAVFVTVFAGLTTIAEPDTIAILTDILEGMAGLPAIDLGPFDLSRDVYLASYGHADMDTVCNLGEYTGVNGDLDFVTFIAVVLDPSSMPNGGGCGPCVGEGGR